jgi:hypothetical protein
MASQRLVVIAAFVTSLGLFLMANGMAELVAGLDGSEEGAAQTIMSSALPDAPASDLP